ncbi:hypothetical protein M9Y10_011825 [Tritrichomonas musculus]|uniref:Phosphatidic acid phosphatase type 2/haloperoxidase domain-containing protein n=1 Tax=Tritrichomonas musculus TaxID=1915356 RepID=A0ABR2IB43_9EUKA
MDIFNNLLTELQAFWNSFIKNIIEWIITICIGGCAIFVAITIEPLHDSAIVDNPTENYPYSGETIGAPVLFFIVIIIPCAVLGIMAILHPRKIDLCLAYMSLAQTLCITLLLTESLKVFVARPRPNYFHYCGYDKEKQACTGPNKYQKDAKVSFPSGHASISFCTGTWLMLFLQSYYNFSGEIWYLLIKFTPIIIAIFISATRITDYMHHVSDVVAGAVLGIGVGSIIFNSQASRIRIQLKRSYDPLAQL